MIMQMIQFGEEKTETIRRCQSDYGTIKWQSGLVLSPDIKMFH